MPPFIPLTLSDVTYRLFRLRRLWAVCCAVPLLALGAGVALHPASPLADPALAVLILTMGLPGFALLLVRWPMAVIGALSLALALGITLAAAAILSPHLGNNTPLILGMITFASHVAIESGLSFAIQHRLMPLPQLTSRQQRIVPHPPEAVFAALAQQPGKTTLNNVCGPVDASGFFPVDHSFYALNPQTYQSETQTTRYHAHILDQGPLHQTLLNTIRWSDGTHTTATHSLHVAPHPQGAALTLAEVHNHFCLMTLITAWLQDYDGDDLTAHLDTLTNRPPRAICLQVMDMPLGPLLRWLKSNTPDET